MQTTSSVSRNAKVLAIMFAAVVAAVLGVAAIAPGSAHASDMKNVIVLKSMKTVSPCTDYTEVDTYEFTYNANGLVTKIKGVDEASHYRHHFKETFTYKKLALKKQVTKYTSIPDGPDKEDDGEKYETNKETYVTRYKTDAKGCVVSASAGLKSNWRYDSKGRLVEINWKSQGMPASCTYKYNSKGQLTRAVFDDMNYGDGTYEFKYDKYGNITLKGGNLKKKRDIDFTYKNTYKKGRLVKSVKRWYEEKSVKEKRTYQYQTIKVPKKAVKMVKEQQRLLTHRWDDAMLNMYGYWDEIASAHA